MRAQLIIGFCVVLVTSAQPAWAASSVDGERLLAPDGSPMFVTGMNYEGPADRAWQMWDNDKFDPAAIEADFVRASSQAGVNVLRIFVQPGLLADINAGRFDKLDYVVATAEKHNLQLIVSLHDYSERDLSKVSAIAGKISAHYAGRSGILAFDLKNEPRFGDLALTRYTSPVPLQQHGLIDVYGERLPRDQLADYRASPDGAKTIPSYLSDDEAYIYVNNLRLYRELLTDAAAWVKVHGGTTLDYLADAAGQPWAPFVAALNASLAAWLAPQVQAIRDADPGRAITVDHVDVILARLPANDVLDIESLHRYPAANGSSIRANLSLLANIEHAHQGKPFLLSEFGYATESLDPSKASLDETAIMLGLLSEGAAGGAKWMLNDMPAGYNMRERTLGAFELNGSPKPIVGALSALRAYLDASGSAPGDFKVDNDPASGIRYVYRAADAVMLGGMQVNAGIASMDAPGPTELFVSWTDPSVLQIWASAPVNASIDVAQVLGHGGSQVVDLSLPGGPYTLKTGVASTRGADYAFSGGHFFTETNGQNGSPTGFSVSDGGGIPFWTAFQSLGGVDVLGYPVSRRFEMDGFVVQAFQKSVLQWRPDQQKFAFMNTFDVLHDRGKDAWLQAYRQTPPPQDTSGDAGLSWERVVARHLAMLDKVPQALKQQFLADPDWLDHYGLPVATQETAESVVVRAQRAALQYWKIDVPWASKGTVTVANGGDLAKEAGIFPGTATTPENAPH